MPSSPIGFRLDRVDLPSYPDPVSSSDAASQGAAKVSPGSVARFTSVKDQHKQHGTGAKILRGLKRIVGRSGTKAAPPKAPLSKAAWTAATPNFRTRLNDATLVKESVKPLSGNAHGAFNAPLKATYRQIDIGTRQAASPRETEIVGKVVGQQLINGEEVAIQKGVGVSGFNPRMIERNVATSILDKHLQTNSVPKASAGILNDKAIVAMSKAPGQTAKEVYDKHPGIVTNPDFQRQMSDIEVNAFLNANPDAHSANYMIDFKEGPEGRYTDVKATMIDNDMSFGYRMLNPDQPPDFFQDKIIHPQIYRHTGLPAYMDATTCSRIKTMDIETIAKDLSSVLDGDELLAFKMRGHLLKDHVAFLEENNRVVGDWAKFESPSGKPLAGGDFITGTLEMSGVQQGTRKDASGAILPVTMPRSMILRDMVQAGRERPWVFNSDRSTTDAQKAALAAWGHVEPTIVPPSGLAHLDSLTSKPKPQPAPNPPASDGTGMDRDDYELTGDPQAAVDADDPYGVEQAVEGYEIERDVEPATGDAALSVDTTDPSHEYVLR